MHKTLMIVAATAALATAATARAGDPISWEFGDEHGCVLNDCGLAHCWGGVNQFFQEDLSAVGGPWTDVAVTTDNSCVLEDTGFVDCWGRHYEGQLNPPYQDYTSIDGGGQHICGVRDNKEVACWGADKVMQSSGVRPNTVYRQVSAGDDFTCAVTTGRNAIDCWGDVPGGVQRLLSWDFLRNHGSVSGVTPERFEKVAAGHDHVCVLSTYKDVYCWGDGFVDRLAPHLNGDATQPFLGACVNGEAGIPEDCVSTPAVGDSEFDEDGEAAVDFALFRTDLGYTWVDVDAAGLGTCAIHYDVGKQKNDVLCWGYPYEYGWGNRPRSVGGWPASFDPTAVDIAFHNTCAWSSTTGETYCEAESTASKLDLVPDVTACDPHNW